jgi:hypothetical protein
MVGNGVAVGVDVSIGEGDKVPVGDDLSVGKVAGIEDADTWIVVTADFGVGSDVIVAVFVALVDWQAEQSNAKNTK